MLAKDSEGDDFAAEEKEAAVLSLLWNLRSW